MNKTDEVLKLIEQLEQKKVAAVDEQLAIISEAQQTLLKLGYNASKTSKSGSGTTRMRDPNKPCGVCGQLGHDGRFHRKDTVGKKKTAKA